MASDETAYWIITVPPAQEDESRAEMSQEQFRQMQARTFQRLERQTASRGSDLAEVYKFEIPSLLVGTLDSLMSLSDDLVKIDASVENVVRKVERQFREMDKDQEELLINDVPAERYLQNFSWEESKYPHRRPLPELVSLIQAGMGKVEDELKQLTSVYSEKKQALSAMQRKRGGNLMVANLEEILTPDIVSERDFVNTEHLVTLVVIVPKNEEETFLSKYETEIGNGLAGYGEAGNRQAKLGSPVVPGSARKLLVKDESLLYTVTLLRGQYQAGFEDDEGQFQQGVFNDFVEPFIQDARKHRFVARPFSFNPTAMEESKRQTGQLAAEEKRLYVSLLRFCSAHFGEAFIAWMHVKAIRAFVESVLRYGLPVNFTSVLFKPRRNKEARLHAALGKMYAHLQGADLGDDDDAGAEFHPYYYNAIKPFSV